MFSGSAALRQTITTNSDLISNSDLPELNELELSVLIMARNEADNLQTLLPELRGVLDGQGYRYEIVVIDGASRDATVSVAESHGALVYQQVGDGYGAAFREGLARCQGTWILTLDADYSHPPQVVRALLANRGGADMLIASRYTLGGDAKMEYYRNFLSRVLGFVFGRGLGIPVKDVSSGFRMYRREVVRDLKLVGRDFDVLIEMLVRIVSNGHMVREVPFIYEPRVFGRSNARLFKFAISYIRQFKRMWNLRNSAAAADYEERAYCSWIPLQRIWQRLRTKYILGLADRNVETLDIGCGASRVSRSLPNLTGLDINIRPLRFLLHRGIPVLQGDLAHLPFKDAAFRQVILSEVLQQISKDRLRLDQVRRVLQSKGTLIVATPDYGSFAWRLLEKVHAIILPQNPNALNRARYTRAEVVSLLEQSGFDVIAQRSIWGMDRIFKAALRS